MVQEVKKRSKWAEVGEGGRARGEKVEMMGYL